MKVLQSKSIKLVLISLLALGSCFYNKQAEASMLGKATKLVFGVGVGVALLLTVFFSVEYSGYKDQGGSDGFFEHFQNLRKERKAYRERIKVALPVANGIQKVGEVAGKVGAFFGFKDRDLERENNKLKARVNFVKFQKKILFPVEEAIDSTIDFIEGFVGCVKEDINA